MKLHQPHSTIVNAGGRASAPWLTMVHAASHDQRYFSSQIQAFQQDFLHAADEMQQRLPHARRVSIAGADGFPMWEAPAQANDHIRKQLQHADVKA